ncbi:murein hydrolase activator EnvC family protein [Dorea sp. D27]|uniref:murein hydrolase activator EnvC family protein n=1 Tax=Dorea sp. D27 TaxID=658665 RepID=UPI0006731DC8|nr:M23 family metallopeptidase [Dorea sp. D27]KMZ52492.1 putative peptidase, M23B family [Dorea sp. D27]
MRGKRIWSVLLVTVLCMGMAIQVNASSIGDTKKKAEELESKKKAAEDEKNSLAAQLDSIVAEMEDTKARIEEKEAEIEKKEEELIQAKVDENDQYESMKKRIQYMYENGNSQFIEILVQSKSIGDFLNNAEYITTISEYDRSMLVQFQEIVKEVEEQEKALQEEYDELETMQNDLIAKQDSINTMLESKNAEISQLESEIGATADTLAKLEAAAAAAARKQAEATQTYSGGSAGAAVVSGNGTFTHPCPGYSYISSEFGWRAQPIPGASSNHKGMDFAAATGTPIYAAAGGTVVSAGYSGNAGNLIIINHGNGLQTYYMHCNNIYVRAGQSVSKGQNIGAVGSTGNSSGPHLHFQVMSGGTPVNPRNYL